MKTQGNWNFGPQNTNIPIHITIYHGKEEDQKGSFWLYALAETVWQEGPDEEQM